MKIIFLPPSLVPFYQSLLLSAPGFKERLICQDEKLEIFGGGGGGGMRVLTLELPNYHMVHGFMVNLIAPAVCFLFGTK